jgi:hypothetical protein
MSSASGLRQPTQRCSLIQTLLDRADALGVVGLRSRVTLHLERGGGRTPTSMLFAVDSGASYSVISLEFAQRRHLTVPPPEAEFDLPLRTAVGSAPIRVRPGRVRAWWDSQLLGYPFDWPVLFQVGAPLGSPSILGLGGVIKTCRWTFDGSYSITSPYGSLILEDIR